MAVVPSEAGEGKGAGSEGAWGPERPELSPVSIPAVTSWHKRAASLGYSGHRPAGGGLVWPALPRDPVWRVLLRDIREHLEMAGSWHQHK